MRRSSDELRPLSITLSPRSTVEGPARFGRQRPLGSGRSDDSVAHVQAEEGDREQEELGPTSAPAPRHVRGAATLPLGVMFPHSC